MCRVTPYEVIEKFVMEYRAEIAAEEAARKAEAEARAKANPARPAAQRGRAAGGDNRVKRCRGYLKTLKPSVEGSDGSKRVYHAARVIWNDFGIDEAEGYPLLEEYNQNSSPVWEEEGKQGLRRKWDEAVKKGPGPEGRGFRLEQDRPGWEPRTTPVFGTRPKGGDGATGGESPAPTPSRGTSGLPEIIINGRQYRDVEADAAGALIAANDPPTVFVGNGCGLVDLCRGAPDSPLAARELKGESMRPIFGRVANWVREKVTPKGQVVLEDDFPPAPLLASFPARGDWPGIPFLRAVVTYPVFGPGWVLNATPGYHPASGLFCDLGGLTVPPVAARPTAADVDAARNLIVTELLGDFPFVDQASRANAVAMLVLPVIRHAIDGPTPLAVIDAPAEGTGKSLLAEVATLATIGEIPEAVSPDMQEDEWSKTLLAMLIEGQPVVYLDNANRKLDSASFASALTARWKRGRILGESKIARAGQRVLDHHRQQLPVLPRDRPARVLDAHGPRRREPGRLHRLPASGHHRVGAGQPPAVARGDRHAGEQLAGEGPPGGRRLARQVRGVGAGRGRHP